MKKEAGDCSLTPSTYRGWKSHLLDNGLVSLQVVPEVGGRVIQFKLGGHEYFWVSPKLAGKLPPPSGLGPGDSWLNYGGEKLWPAPQGWDNDAEWPGPPGAVLDGLPYAVESLPGNEPALRLTSGNDPLTGVRFSRVIRVSHGTTRVSFEATMTNIDTKPRRWGMWSVAQVDAGMAEGGYNPLLHAWCRMNPDSHFAHGYNVIFGAKDNPSFQPGAHPGLMRVDYQYKVGKIGLDCKAGWTAAVNGQTGHVFVQQFEFKPGTPYPDGSSVEIWLNGVGKIHAYKKEMSFPDDVAENPYVMECEILGPLTELKPGESSTWHYGWAATNIGGNFPVIDCTHYGVVSEPLQAVVESSSKPTCKIRGRFGSFVEGRAALHFLDGKGTAIGRSDLPGHVSPMEQLLVNASVQLPPHTAAVELALMDAAGQSTGPLAHATVVR